jgi:hypothetical protein
MIDDQDFQTKSFLGVIMSHRSKRGRVGGPNIVNKNAIKHKLSTPPPPTMVSFQKKDEKILN